MASEKPYTVRPLELGAEVYGIDLKLDVSDETFELIKQDILKHKVLVFRDQGIIPPERHAEIGWRYGELEVARLDGYSKTSAPHENVFRVSNKDNEGAFYTTRHGWHTDGFYIEKPNLYTILHMVAVPKTGATTLFSDMETILNGLSEKKRSVWQQAWFRSNGEENLKGEKVMKSLITRHPATGADSLAFHIQRTDTNGLVYNYGSNNERATSDQETRDLLRDIEFEIERAGVYTHKWKEGDFVIFDNFAVIHCPGTETKKGFSDVGERAMHWSPILAKE